MIPSPLSPPTHFIGSLWAKLAVNDPTLTPLADGFRITNTYPVSGSLAFKSYKLADVTTPQIIQNVRREFPSWSRLGLLVLDLLSRTTGLGSRRQATS